MSVRVTSRQADAVEWAIDAMVEFWADDDADPDGVVPRPVVLPTVAGRSVTITGVHPEVLSDLRYRLVDHLDDVEADAGRRNTAGRNAWARIAAVAP